MSAADDLNARKLEGLRGLGHDEAADVLEGMFAEDDQRQQRQPEQVADPDAQGLLDAVARSRSNWTSTPFY